jgi:hypothetical protein
VAGAEAGEEAALLPPPLAYPVLLALSLPVPVPFPAPPLFVEINLIGGVRPVQLCLCAWCRRSFGGRK